MKSSHPRGRFRRPAWHALAVSAMLGALVVGGAAIADTGVTIDPATNDFTLEEGETWSEEIVVTVPADTAAAAVDVYFLADTTGSMGGPINAVRSGASVIIDDLITQLPDTDLQFGVGDFKDFQSPSQSDPYAFRHAVSITGDTDAVKAGINAWGASGGGDGPEGQFYAFDQVADNRAPSNDGSAAGTIGWRSGTARVLVVFADAPAHDPVCSAITSQVDGHALAYDITEATVTAKLASAGITFIGISTLTGFANGMDANPGNAGNYASACGAETSGTAGAATRLAEATGGVHQIGIDNDSIVAVIAEEVLAAARNIASLTLVPTGETAAFVDGLDPEAGFGPFETSESSTFTFNVDWLGIVEASDEDQVFTGTLDVVADGTVVASKSVRITVPGVATEVLGEAEEAEETGEADTTDTTDKADKAEAAPATPVRARPTYTG